MKVFISVILAAVVIVFILVAVQSNSPVTTQSNRTNTIQTHTSSTALPGTIVEWECNGHVSFGLPGSEDQLLCRDGYAVGYDVSRKVPNWVAYHITKESVSKKHKRSNKFMLDTELSKNSRSNLSDYKGSGYDRGHMAPAATVDFSKESMQESFLLSNMTPQLPGLNRQGWKYLEEHVRDWAEERGDLYVVTGSLFEGEIATIGDHVSIPSGFYKVVFDPSHNDGIAFIVPQRNISKADLPGFIVTIDHVEERAGLDFISVLSDDIESSVENRLALMW